jgi:hypothetical protein
MLHYFNKKRKPIFGGKPGAAQVARYEPSAVTTAGSGSLRNPGEVSLESS